MIAFDLKCAQGHTFEGWFDSAEDFEKQSAKGQVSCPVCNDINVERVPSAFAIGGKSGGDLNSQEAAAMMGKALKRYLKENFDDVGADFSKEALKMHYGATEPRNIRGVSTPDEEDVLRKEGIQFFKVGAGESEPSGKEPEED